MERIKEFIKNKSIGYFIVAGLALYSLIFGVIFLLTFSNPDVTSVMGNKASAFVPATIGIFMLAGFLVELVVLCEPQYRFVQLVAVAMFGLAFYKDVLIIPDFFAGMANGVMYNGGNLGLNMFYFISTLLIAIISVVPLFMGLYKKEEEATADMPIQGKNKLVRVASCGAVVLAAVLASSLITVGLKSTAPKKDNGSSSQQGEKKEKKDPITDEIKAAADAVAYDFNPENIIIEQEENYSFDAPTLAAVKSKYNSSLNPLTNPRDDADLVYLFEGVFSEGYHGGYGTYTANLYLWDDGIYGGVSNGTRFFGFWYNSSIDFGEDGTVADCLNMVSDSSNFKSIITDPVKGFYQRQGYVYLNPGWGGRSVVVSGYKYYPNVAIFVDTDEQEEFKVGDVFNRSTIWAVNKVIKNLSYTPVVDVDSVKWTYPENMLDDTDKFTAAGEYTIQAEWEGFSTSVTITVSE